MTDSQATLCAYVASLAFMLGYRVYIAMAQRLLRKSKEIAPKVTAERIAVIREVKPLPLIKAS